MPQYCTNRHLTSTLTLSSFETPNNSACFYGRFIAEWGTFMESNIMASPLLILLAIHCCDSSNITVLAVNRVLSFLTAV